MSFIAQLTLKNLSFIKNVGEMSAPKKFIMITDTSRVPSPMSSIA